MNKDKNENRSLQDAAISGGLFETVARHGDAGAEFLKGLRGVDKQTGQTFDRSLLDVAGYKINPDYAAQNIKQQAGFSAEIAAVSKRNAEALIKGESRRFVRSEDLAQYGKNHNCVDIVELMDNQEITSQMKFTSNTDDLLKKIACGEGGGENDLSRYLSVDKLELPTEQVKGTKTHCKQQAAELKKQAEACRQKGNLAQAEELEEWSGNYQTLKEKITDSGLTTEEAINYRLNPRWETAKDIAGVSHRAGLEGAKFGAAIGGGISAITNAIAACSGNKELGEAVCDAAKDTLVSAGVGYGTAFAGTSIKTYMQQSGSTVIQNLSKTGLPAAIVSACMATAQSVSRYVKGEINAGELAEEMGLTATGMLSASMFTLAGQIAIPIPVLGGLIGGMVGYAVTNQFYRGFFDALKEAELSAQRRQEIEIKCAAAAALAKQYETGLKELFAAKVAQLDAESQAVFAVLENPHLSADEWCAGMNRFAAMLGKKISINNMAELDAAMLSDDTLTI